MEDIHKRQDPPYSKGMLLLEVHRGFRAKKFSNNTIYLRLSEPVLAQMGRYDYVYCDPAFARFSRVRLEGYLLFSEMMAKQYPGYMLDRKGHIVTSTDALIDLDELLNLFRSKDIARYEADRDKLFGFTSRYTS